ncbi:MAG: hypothetical protein ACE5KM_12310, partial [Planctomycetaceae bacterium]
MVARFRQMAGKVDGNRSAAGGSSPQSIDGGITPEKRTGDAAIPPHTDLPARTFGTKIVELPPRGSSGNTRSAPSSSWPRLSTPQSPYEESRTGVISIEFRRTGEGNRQKKPAESRPPQKTQCCTRKNSHPEFTMAALQPERIRPTGRSLVLQRQVAPNDVKNVAFRSAKERP